MVRILGVLGAGPQRQVIERAGPARGLLAKGRQETLAGSWEEPTSSCTCARGDARRCCRRPAGRRVSRTSMDWNIFGQVDRSTDEPRFACHLFISKTCSCATGAGWGTKAPGFHHRHRVQHLPIDLASLRDLAPDRAEARRRLGLDPEPPGGRPHGAAGGHQVAQPARRHGPPPAAQGAGRPAAVRRRVAGQGEAPAPAGRARPLRAAGADA